MSEVTANLNQVLRVLEEFSPQELAVIEERLAARKRVSEQPLDATADLFELPFDHYLAMSREERDAIALRAYQTLGTWIDAELKRLGAEWMLVCGGEVIESSPTLQNYPSREKLMQAGRQRGLVPFVFVREPLIEESGWSALAGDDFYPTIRLTVAADYQPVDLAHFRSHLGQAYRFHVLPLLIGVRSEDGMVAARELQVLCVLDWRQTPLCLVNTNREALAGRNLLIEFPLRLELDGAKRVTHVALA